MMEVVPSPIFYEVMSGRGCINTGDYVIVSLTSPIPRSATSRASFGGFNFNSNRNAAGADYDDGYDTGRGNRNLKFMER